MIRTQEFWTYQVSNSTLLIDETFGLGMISIMLTSGTATVSGSVNAGGLPSSNLALTIGLPITFGGNQINPISGITIAANSGSVYLIGR
jgi:hypothetical protein